MTKRADDIDIGAAILRWRIRRAERKLAGVRAKSEFWGTRSLVKGGGLPMSVTNRLCTWAGEIGELEHQIADLRKRLAARDV